MSTQNVYFTNPAVIQSLQTPTSLYDQAPYRDATNNAALFNTMKNWNVNLQNTRNMPTDMGYRRAAMTAESTLFLQCQTQQPLSSNTGTTVLLQAYNGIFDEDYYYTVGGPDEMSWSGNIQPGDNTTFVNQANLFGTDQQGYGTHSIVYKINRHTGVTVFAKQLGDITGKPTIGLPRNIQDTGDSQSRGPLFMYGDNLYITGQETKYSSLIKFDKNTFNLVAYAEIPSALNPIVTYITGANGVDFTGPAWKVREMREVLVIPPISSSVRPGIHSDFYTYPLILAMSTVNNLYTMTTFQTASRYQVYNNWFQGSGEVFAWLDKGTTLEYLWNFSMAPQELQPGQNLPSSWFGPTGPNDPIYNQTPFITVPLYDGFKFCSFASSLGGYWSTVEQPSFFIFEGNYTYINLPAPYNNGVLSDMVQAMFDLNKLGTVTFTDGQVFNKNQMYTGALYGTGGLAAGPIGTYTFTGSAILGQAIKMFVKPGFTIPTGTLDNGIAINTNKIGGDAIARMAGHYGAGIWGSPAWDPKKGYLYIPGGNPINFPEYERVMFGGGPTGGMNAAINKLSDAHGIAAYNLLERPIIKHRVSNRLSSAATVPNYNAPNNYQIQDYIQGFSTESDTVIAAQRAFIDYALSIRDQKASARFNRMGDSGIIAMDPYSANKASATLKWKWKFWEGGAWRLDSILFGSDGISREPNQAYYGQPAGNQDCTHISLINLLPPCNAGTDAAYVGPRVLVAGTKGAFALLDPDAYFSCTGADPTDPAMKNGILQCQPPLFGSTAFGATGWGDMIYIPNHINYVQNWPGQIAHAYCLAPNGGTQWFAGSDGNNFFSNNNPWIQCSNSSVLNMLLMRSCGGQVGYAKSTSTGPALYGNFYLNPFATTADDAIVKSSQGNLTCYNLDTLTGRYTSAAANYSTQVNRNTMQLKCDGNTLTQGQGGQPAVIWQIVVKDGVLVDSTWTNLGNYGYNNVFKGNNNTELLVYGNTVFVGTTMGVVNCYDVRSGRLRGQFGTIESANHIVASNNSVFFVGGYGKWQSYQAGSNYFYKFTVNGQ